MPEHDLGTDLGVLADHAGRTGRLAAAGAVRARADRRRRSRYAATGAFAVVFAGALGVGIAVAQPGPGPHPGPPASTGSASTPAPSPSASPSSSTSPSAPPSRGKPPSTATSSSAPPVSPGAADPFSGTRQVFLLPENSESTVGVGQSGQLGLSDAFDDRDLFVLTPLGGGKYWIRTAKLRIGGEASCVAVPGSAGQPGPVVTVACDASAENQKFLFRQTGTVDGKPKYTIRTGSDVYLVLDPQGQLSPGGTGVVAAPIGEGTPDIDTPFLLPDQGKASLPTLD